MNALAMNKIHKPLIRFTILRMAIEYIEQSSRVFKRVSAAYDERIGTVPIVYGPKSGDIPHSLASR
jgi:hypothetical protein